MGRAGTPMTVCPSGTFWLRVTTALAPTTASSPTVTGAIKMAPAPRRARDPIWLGFFRTPSKFAVTTVAPMLAFSPTFAVTEICQVANDRAGTNVRLLDLDEGADFHTVAQDCSVTKMCVRTDAASGADFDGTG